jgi:hypothetical protein
MRALAGTLRCRHVALAGDGAERGAVRLDQQPLEGEPPHELLLLPRAHDRRRYREEVARFDTPLCARRTAVEGVELHAARPVLEEHGDRVAPGGARVDVERQVQLDREPDEPHEDLPLQLELGRIGHLPVVEADLSDRDQALGPLADPGGEPPGFLEVDTCRMQSRGGEDLRVLGGQLEIAPRVGEGLGDGDDRDDPRLARVLEHATAIGVERDVADVRVAVDEHGSASMAQGEKKSRPEGRRKWEEGGGGEGSAGAGHERTGFLRGAWAPRVGAQLSGKPTEHVDRLARVGDRLEHQPAARAPREDQLVTARDGAIVLRARHQQAGLRPSTRTS